MDTTSHSFSVPRTARWWSAGPLEKSPAGGTLIVLHGYGQLAEILHPEVPASPKRAGTWSLQRAPTASTSRARRARRGQLDDQEARLDDIVDYVRVPRCPLDPERAGRPPLLGFSQGVATVLRWAALGGRGASWDGLIAHSGVIPSDLRQPRWLLGRRPASTFWWARTTPTSETATIGSAERKTTWVGSVAGTLTASGSTF